MKSSDMNNAEEGRRTSSSPSAVEDVVEHGAVTRRRSRGGGHEGAVTRRRSRGCGHGNRVSRTAAVQAREGGAVTTAPS